jgi:hypothetical protein
MSVSVTDGHGVPPVSNREEYVRLLLGAVEAGNGVSQRSLAKTVGIALGLTNLLLKRLVRKRWIRVIHIKPNRVSYLITPAGMAEKARMSRAYFARTTRFYVEARNRVRHSLATLSCEWRGPGEKRVVFFGAGEVAEIGYLCIQGTDLRLIGVIDDDRVEPFFGIAVDRASGLQSSHLNDRSFWRLIVMSFDESDLIRERLKALGISSDRVYWI